MRGGLDVAAGGEAGQQDEQAARGEGELRHGEAVHVVERGGDEDALGGKVWPAGADLQHPEVAAVGEHDALGAAG